MRVSCHLDVSCFVSNPNSKRKLFLVLKKSVITSVVPQAITGNVYPSIIFSVVYPPLVAGEGDERQRLLKINFFLAIPHSMWDVSSPMGLKQYPLHCEAVLTTGQSGKSLRLFIVYLFL